MNKIRSSRELKESIENVTKVIDNEINVDPVVSIDPVMVDAVQQNKEAEEHVAEVLDELDKAAEDIIEEDPKAELPVKNAYTAQLKLDESIEDFRIDGRSHKVGARGEDEGDSHLDYSMYEFVSELLSGKNCNTNPAPITPIVWRRDPKDKTFKYLEMKKFATQGEDSVSYEGANLSGDFSEDEFDFEDDMSNATDTQGMYKAMGVPQIGFEDNGFVVYSNSLEDLEQAQQGLSHYGIKYDSPQPRRNRRSHWKYSMKVYIPANSKGEFLTLQEWLDKTERKIENVMRPDFVKTYLKKKNKKDSAEDAALVQDIFNSYLEKARLDADASLETLLTDLFNDLEGISYNKEAVEADFRSKFAKVNKEATNLKTSALTDAIIDEYADKAMDIDPDDHVAMKALYSEMCDKLTQNGIKCGRVIRSRFSAETGYEF